ncbi:penicillin-binding protein [uncultured Rikenella sp.]|uniref:penicillin-binding protein n=1 Tax=uncultured Rikenella sp. TaxID=368003 RepID=UPI0025DB6FC8|nr:penicillin-binding protein [uncultured Rikenella sp.]
MTLPVRQTTEPETSGNPQRSPIKEAILRRVKLLYILFLFTGLAVLIRIVWLQIGSGSSTLRDLSNKYSYRTEIVEGARGNIYSDDGRLLAISIPYYELRMDMAAGGLSEKRFFDKVDSLSTCLSDFFGDKTPEEYHKELVEAQAARKRFHLITRRKVNFLELQTIRQFPLFRLGANRGGFMAIESNRRVNPHGELARRTLGFVNQWGVKLGIEGGFDNYLKGEPGQMLKQKISGNFWTPIASDRNIDPIDGYDVVSTLNIEMQDMVQSALREWIVEVEADWGCVAVMEVQTGDIKALSNVTRRSDGTLVEDYNYVIGMSMEPGSTFKLAGLIALLDDAHMSLSTPIETGNGVEQIGPVRVVDSHIGGFGRLTLQQVFEKSSNIGMAKAVNRAYGSQPAKFVNALNRIGIHKPLDLQLAGEAKPLIKHPAIRNGWDGTTLTMMSYGYALRLAPIHTLTLFNAVANDGVMVKPMFVRELRQYDKTVLRFPTDTLNPAICSKSTLRDVQRAMEGAVTNGTGRLLLNPKYRVAAKTGTAQVAIGRHGYVSRSGGRHYLGSIAGYLPADRPKYSIVVALKTYHSENSQKTYYGGSLAGPLFKTVADRVFSMHYNVTNRVVTRPQTFDPMLNALSGSASALDSLLRELRVTGTPRLPYEGRAAIDSGGRVVVSHPVSATSDSGVPDFRGLTLIEALERAESVGLKPKFVGMGTVRSQSLPSGTPIESGSEITLTLDRQ